MMKKNKEIRAFNFEVRANQNDEHGHFLSGTPIVFDSRTDLGWYDEIIAPGALDEADLKDVRFLINHNTDMIPLARSRNNNERSTMQLEVTEDGMNIRVDLDVENNSEAKSLYSAVERGDLDGMSFMFRVRSQEWLDIDSDIPTRIIKDISIIHEVSVVNFPAYQGTSVSARNKSSEGDYSPLAEAREQIGNDRRKAAAAEVEKIKYDYLRRI